MSSARDKGATMTIPAELKYTKDHEWAKLEADQATIGITAFAQDQLGALVYVDLPALGDTITAGEVFGEVESVKSVSELVAPLSGEVIEVNTALDAAPETINDDPYGEGWIIKISLSEVSEADDLLDASAYAALIA